MCSYKIRSGLERKMSTGKGIIAYLDFPLRFTVSKLLTAMVSFVCVSFKWGEHSTKVSKMLLSSLSLRISSP